MNNLEKNKNLFCSNCGQIINNNSNFCRKCGTEVNKNNLKRAYLLCPENESKGLYRLLEENGKFITDKYFTNKEEALEEFENKFELYKIVLPDKNFSREDLLNKYKNRYKKFQKKDILGAILGMSIGWVLSLFGLIPGALGMFINISIGILITRIMLNSDKLYLKVLYWVLFIIILWAGSVIGTILSAQ